MSKIKSFKNKVIIITGASSGLGKQLAIDFSSKEAKLVLVSRTLSKLVEVEKLLKLPSESTLIIQADITDKADIKKIVEKTMEKFARIDILINNAGIEKMARFEDLSRDEIELLIKTNYTGPVMLMNEIIPIMMSQGGGNVANIGSMVTLMPTPFQEVYSGAKLALRGTTKSLNFGYNKHNIHFSIIEAPGISGSGIMDRMLSSNIFKAPKVFPTVPVEKVSKIVIMAIKKRKERIPLMMPSIFFSGMMVKMMVLFPFMGKLMMKRMGMLRFMGDVAEYRINNRDKYNTISS